MWCYYSYVYILLLVAVIAQVSCNDGAVEIDNREKRQAPHDRGRHRGHPHHRDEGPGRYRDGYDDPERREDPPDSLFGGGTNNMVNMPMMESRFGETQNQGVGVGISLGLGGGAGSQNAAALSLRAAENAATLARGGAGGMGNFGGIQNMMGNANIFGFQAAEMAANAGRGSMGGGYPTTGSRSPNLLNIGGLITIGGQPNQPQTGNYDNRPSRDPQGPEFTNPQPHQGDRPPSGQQGGPGSNSPGHQNNNRPSRPPGQQPGRPGQPPGRPDQQAGRPGERPGQSNGRPVENEVYGNGRPGESTHQGPPGGRPGGNSYVRPVEEEVYANERPGGSGYQSQPGGRPSGSNGQNSGNGNNAQQLNLQGQGGGGGSKKCRGNQHTCRNRECVQRNARCNGVTECQDGSDESNCYTSDNRPGDRDSSSNAYTTAAPYGGLTTTASPTAGGCILPEQPVGGNYELGSCPQPCSVQAGSRVSLSSYLTYTCDHGYTLNGHNTTFCHGGSWYLSPTCVKTCSPLKSNSVDIECKLHGEKVLCDKPIAPGTKATLACKHSFKIPLTEDPAYRELTCLEDGIWDRTLFRCLPECGTAVAHGNTLIVSGFTAKLGVFPWHVGIYERNAAGSYDQICAGTLVSPSLVISAAHCFYDDTVNEVTESSKYAVGAGKHYRLYNMQEKYAQKSLVKKIDVASRYYGANGNFAEDISLVHLQTPFTLTTLVRPVCMDWDNVHESEQLQSGQTGKAVGWGKTAEGTPSTELQEINLPYIPYQECVSAVPTEFKGYVTADKFCAGYLNGSSLCEGDSGGGLCFQLNGLWYLRGIVSVSPVSENTCDNNYYTAFTNVGRFKEWIRAAYISTD